MSGAVRSVTKAVTGAVKGAAKTVKKVAKSDIGQVALAVAAPYAMGPAFASMGLAGSIGGSAFLGNALRAGITNLALQGVTTGRFDLGQAAKAGAIGGGITTALQGQKFFGPQQRNNLLSNGVTEGSDILYETMGPETGQFPTTEASSARFADFSPRVGAGDEQVFGITPNAQTTPSYESITKPIDTLAKVPAKSGITQLPVDAEVEALKVQQGGADYLKKQGINIGQKSVGEFQGIKSIFQDQSLPLGDKIKLSAQNLIGVGGGDESLLQLKNNPSIGNLVNFAKSNPTAIIGSTSLMAALTAPKQPEETEFEYEERSALADELGNEYLENIDSDLSGSDFNSISDWESFFTARIGRAFGGSTEMPMGKPRKNAGGIMELDYRDEGGFVPIGIKEKADDVPAMLSKNEFVFTADAVKNAGNGDVDKGAERLYKQMKMLENGGSFA